MFVGLLGPFKPPGFVPGEAKLMFAHVRRPSLVELLPTEAVHAGSARNILHVFFHDEDSSSAITSRLVAAVSCSAPPPSAQDETNSTHQVAKDLSSCEWGESRRNKGKTRRSSMDRVDESGPSDSLVQTCKQAQAIGLWTTTGSVPSCHAGCTCTDVHALWRPLEP